MANQTYYDVLGVAPSAGPHDIEAACDALYNKWRALVNHPDQELVSQANDAMQKIELIRATLGDSAKREAYDTGVGLRGQVGGLADPTAVLQRYERRMPTPPGSRSSSAIDAPAHLNAWVCAKCGFANPVGTRFCQKCGQSLGVNCAQCGQLVQAQAAYCPNCGVNMREAAEIKEEQQRAAEQARRKDAVRQAALQQVITLAEEARGHMRMGWILAFIFAWAAPFLWWQAMKRARAALAMPRVQGDEYYRGRAESAYNWSRGGLILLAVMVVITVIILVAAAQ